MFNLSILIKYIVILTKNGVLLVVIFITFLHSARFDFNFDRSPILGINSLIISSDSKPRQEISIPCSIRANDHKCEVENY